LQAGQLRKRKRGEEERRRERGRRKREIEGKSCSRGVSALV
jgi:hypothetical protein